MPVVKTGEDTPALHMLDIFKEKKTHIVIVTNEYDGTEGLITQSDVMDSIVGEIEPEFKKEEITRLSDKKYLLSGSLPIDEFKSLLKETYLPNEEEEFKTLAGFIMTNLGNVPKENDEFHGKGYTLKVLEMKKNRILKVELTLL